MTTKPIYLLVFILSISFSFPTTVHAFQKNKDKFVVVLDAGHGGHDSGNLGSGYKEKEIALKIVLAVGESLASHKAIEVIYTRDDDTFVTLRGRAKIANDADADLFVSIHCNAHNSDAHGSETFVLGLHANQRNFEIAKKENEVIYLEADYERHYEGFNPNSPESLIGLTLIQEEYLDQSIALARAVEDNFKNQRHLNSRGVKQAGFWVLHNTYMPSVLIETGFLTYKKEGAFLNSSSGQIKMAASITDAILKYKRHLDLNIGADNFKPEIENLSDVLEAEPDIYEGIVFKVQIAASSKELDPKPYNFKGLENISREKVGKLYKYFYGQTSDYAEVRRLELVAKSKGYTSAFVKAFKNDKSVNLATVLKTASSQ